MLARGERIQFSWNQLSGFIADEEIWQLDNVALLYSTTINSSLVGTFSGLEESTSIMLYSGGIIEVINIFMIIIHVTKNTIFCKLLTVENFRGICGLIGNCKTFFIACAIGFGYARLMSNCKSFPA